MYTNRTEDYHHYSLREINLLAPDCTASEWKNQDSEADISFYQLQFRSETTAHALKQDSGSLLSMLNYCVETFSNFVSIL